MSCKLNNISAVLMGNKLHSFSPSLINNSAIVEGRNEVYAINEYVVFIMKSTNQNDVGEFHVPLFTEFWPASNNATNPNRELHHCAIGIDFDNMLAHFVNFFGRISSQG